MHWLHYVGGFYSPAKFIAEAKRNGVARRVSPSMAHTMSFGDVVTLLNWRGGEPAAFAAFTITRITLQADIAQMVGDQLAEEGKAHSVAGGGQVVRECGSYDIQAVYAVDVPLEEIVEKAVQTAKKLGVKCSFMVGGPLSQVFDPPYSVDAPFTRGFIKAGEEANSANDPQIVGIEGYKTRTRKARLDLQLTLGF